MEKLLINADDFIGTKELRSDMTSILSDIKENDRTVVITTQGKPAGILLSVEGYLSLLEEIEDLQNAELVAEIALARKEIAEGKTMTLDDYLADRAKKASRKKKKRVA